MASQRKIARQIAALTSEEMVQRREAALKLGTPGNRAAVGPLCAALDDASWFVRRNAARARGRHGKGEAVGPLCKALKDKSGGVRREAVIALGKIGEERAIAPLCQALKDKKRSVRESAIEALVCAGPLAVVPLCRILDRNTASTALFLHGERALRQLLRQGTTEALYAVLKDVRLSMAERLNFLEMLRDYAQRMRWFTSAARRTDARRFCESVVRAGTDAAARESAQALLDYITLVRAGERDRTTEKDSLLRGAQSGIPVGGTDSLLRASGLGSMAADAASAPPGFLRRLFRRLLQLLRQSKPLP